MKFDHEHASVEQNKETKPNIAATIVNQDPKNQKLGTYHVAISTFSSSSTLQFPHTSSISTRGKQEGKKTSLQSKQEGKKTSRHPTLFDFY